MHREYYVQEQAHYEQRFEDALKDAAIVHIGGAVQGDEGVAIGQPVYLAVESLWAKAAPGNRS
jgi:hypothetical protein